MHVQHFSEFLAPFCSSPREWPACPSYRCITISDKMRTMHRVSHLTTQQGIAEALAGGLAKSLFGIKKGCPLSLLRQHPYVMQMCPSLTSIIVQHVVVIQAKLQVWLDCIGPLERVDNHTVCTTTEQVACSNRGTHIRRGCS